MHFLRNLYDVKRRCESLDTTVDNVIEKVMAAPWMVPDPDPQSSFEHEEDSVATRRLKFVHDDHPVEVAQVL